MIKSLFFKIKDKKFIQRQNLSTRFCSSVAMSSQSNVPKLSDSDVNQLLDALKPKEIVDQLDRFIIGQADAKRAVAIALRNRWRRHRLAADLKYEVIPKNILMVGPTGCGKTEIARRIAKLSQAPFIKVEATKFTEVGFHGKDVDQIIRDLLDISINMTKKKIKEDMKERVTMLVDDMIVNIILGENTDEKQRKEYVKLLKEGNLENETIQIEVPSKPPTDKNTTISFDSNSSFPGEFFKTLGKAEKRTEKKKMKISEARPILEELHSEKLLDDHDVIKEAINSVEENGIVFIGNHIQYDLSTIYDY